MCTVLASRTSTRKTPQQHAAIRSRLVWIKRRDTASGEGVDFEPSQEVIILDVFRDMASVVVHSEPFTEYLHLGRFGDRWLIVNAFYRVLV